jgi:phage terminase small subunit
MTGQPGRSGGARSGSGRPCKQAEAIPMQPPRQALPCGHQDALSYVQALMNDPTADPLRRDRAAFALLNLLARHGGLNKRELAERAAATSDKGSPWEPLLHLTLVNVPTAEDQEERERQQRTMDWQQVLDLNPPRGSRDDPPRGNE